MCYLTCCLEWNKHEVIISSLKTNKQEPYRREQLIKKGSWTKSSRKRTQEGTITIVTEGCWDTTSDGCYYYKWLMDDTRSMGVSVMKKGKSIVRELQSW